jgi:hypothetical protein
MQQKEILETMSEIVLISNPQLWEQFYGPCLLDNDSISRLELSALQNDTNAVLKLKLQFHAAAVVGDENFCEKKVANSIDKISFIIRRFPMARGRTINLRCLQRFITVLSYQHVQFHQSCTPTL